MRDDHLVGRATLAVVVAVVLWSPVPARAATDLKISAVERVQVVQTATNDIPLVLGKPLAVRVYVDVGPNGTAGPGAGGDWVVSGASLDVYRGATLAGTLTPYNSRIAVAPRPTPYTTYRPDGLRSFNFRIPESMQSADGLTIVATINNNRAVPETDYTNNGAIARLAFVQTTDLRFKASQYVSPDHPYSDARWEDNLVQARRLSRWWPTERVLVYGHGSYQIWSCCPTGDTTDGWWPGTGSVTARANRSRAAADTLSDVLWYVLQPWDTCGCGSAYDVSTTPTAATGQDNGGPAADTRGGTPNTRLLGAVMAQEIAHGVFAQLHTGHVNEFADPACCPHGIINARFPSTLGFDPIAMTLIPAGNVNGSHTHDFMSYGGAPVWVSDYTYLRLLDAHRVSPSSAVAARPRATAVPRRPYLLINGSVGVRGAIGPGYVLDRPAGTNDKAGTGAYSLDLVAEDGRTLFTRNFDVHPPHDLNTGAAFSQIVPYTNAVRRLVLRSGSTVLATRDRSPNAPTVSIIKPGAGVHWEGARQVEWQATDADGDPLVYLVQYSSNGGRTWETVASDITDTRFAIDAEHLEGSRDCRIRVLASDGLNTTIAVSARFGVTQHPPSARILSARVDRLGQAVLEGRAYDADDVVVPDARIRWRSHRDGRLGRGESLTTRTLSPGRHRITFTVTDSSGNRARATQVLRAPRLAPRAPTRVRTVTGRRRVRVLWAHRSGTASRYVVQRARRGRIPVFTTIRKLPASRRAVTDHPPRGVHFYRIGACRGNRCTFSRSVRTKAENEVSRRAAAGR